MEKSVAYEAVRELPELRSGRDLAAVAPVLLSLLVLGWLILLPLSCSREDSETATGKAASTTASISSIDREEPGSGTPSRPGQSSPDAFASQHDPDPEHSPDLPAGRPPRPSLSPSNAVTAGTTDRDTGTTDRDTGTTDGDTGGKSSGDGSSQPDSEPENTPEDSSTSATTAADENLVPARAPGAPEGFRNPGSRDTGSRDTEPQNTRRVPAYRVEQVTEGVPDPRPGMPPRKELQVLTVAKDGQRIVLDKFSLPSARATPHLLERYILRLDRDPPVLWVEAPDGSWYEEHHGDLTKIQKERRIREFEILAKAKEYPRKEREAILRLNHLRPDGKREVTVEWGETRQLLGKECRRLIVKENGRVIIDSLVSEDIAGGRGFFNLYSRLGAFSPEVLEKIRDVRGLPLAGSITVVTKLTAHPFRFEVKRFEEIMVPDDLFDRPAGEKREPRSDEVRCAQCGKPGEVERMEFLRFQGPKYFCDTDCKRLYLEERFGRTSVPEKK